MATREYHREYSRKYYHDRKKEYLELLGGKCSCCGAREGLHFDHIRRESKLFPIGKLLNYSKKDAAKELRKCQLLCTVCHKKKTRDNEEGPLKRARGESVGTSKLRSEDVKQIRELRSSGLTHQGLADRFAVSRSTISSILNNRSWRHI